MIDEKKLIEELDRKLYGMQIISKRIVLDIINEQPKVGEWIPCIERLPEEDGNLYWTTHEDGSIILHGYTNRNGFIYNWEVDDLEKRKRQGGVIAWMLIEEPEPYRGEEHGTVSG